MGDKVYYIECNETWRRRMCTRYDNVTTLTELVRLQAIMLGVTHPHIALSLSKRYNS